MTGRNVIVVTTVERSDEALRKAIGGEINQLHVVVPSVHQSRLDWLANADNEAIDRAQDTAEQVGRDVPSERTTSMAGDSDPRLAAADALRQFKADELVAITRPDEEAAWLEEGTRGQIAAHLHGIPVRTVELSDEGQEHPRRGAFVVDPRLNALSAGATSRRVDVVVLESGFAEAFAEGVHLPFGASH